VGLLEKYVTAQWGVNPSVMNRERPASQPAAPPQPEQGDASQPSPTPPAPQPAAVPEPAESDDVPPPAPAGDDF